ncbi:MAG: NUDIX domain-containing protein [Deinococcales bacterium]
MADRRDTHQPAAADEPHVVDEVVTCFLRHRGDVLLVRRSGRVGSYRGRWGAISGFAEGDPLEDAWREITEETGLEAAVSLVKQGEPFAFEDPQEGRHWRVNPFLFDAASREAHLDWEAEEGVWVSPAEILTRDTVARLWTSYERVAPTVEDLRADREHGSAWLSLRAVEALRDRAAARVAEVPDGAPAARRELLALARDLAAARPAMTAVRNRVNRAMAAALEAGRDDAAAADAAAGTPQRVLQAAEAALRAAIDADEGAARETARLVAGRRVLTLSSSGTVADGLLTAAPAPARVIVCESRPGAEGRALAGRLAEAGLSVVVVPDAAVAWALEAEQAELVLLGADAVMEDGALVNKVGTRPAALAARAAGVRVLAAAATDIGGAGGGGGRGGGGPGRRPRAAPRTAVRAHARRAGRRHRQRARRAGPRRRGRRRARARGAHGVVGRGTMKAAGGAGSIAPP